MAARTAIAVAKGQNIQQAAVALAKGAAVSLVPGNNAIIKDAVSDLASGKSLADTAMRAGGNLASQYAPKGLENVVSDLASGKSLTETALKAGSSTMATFSPLATGPFSSLGPRIKDTIASQNLNKLLPGNVSTVANAVLKNASLRGLTVNELAAKLNVPNHIAREGMASVLQSVIRSGGASVPHLAPAQELAAKIPMTATFDQAMANFASKMSPIAFSHNARRPMQIGTRYAAMQIAKMKNPHIVPVYAQQSRGVSLARAAAINPWQRPSFSANGFIDAGAIDPTAPPTLRQGSTGAFVSQWQNILKTTADGKFGPQTTSLTRQFQALKGLTADGIVGPNTWKAGLVSIAAPISTPVSVPGLPPVSVPGLPPVVSAPIANAMPTIRQGSTGTAVKTWQAIVGVPVDGQFGPQTATATRAWQSKNGLTADGIVGPNTWTKALAGGATTIPTPPPPTTPGIPTSLPPISIPIPGGGPPIVVQPPTPPWSETPPIFQPPTSVPTAPPIVTTTTPIPGGPVITTTTPTGGGPIVVSQPPITEPPTKSGMGPGIAIAVGLGLLLFVAKGSSGKLV
jgi:peptidoglycan hydrolase-like protein with peptidoglycan-binding domain